MFASSHVARLVTCLASCFIRVFSAARIRRAVGSVAGVAGRTLSCFRGRVSRLAGLFTDGWHFANVSRTKPRQRLARPRISRIVDAPLAAVLLCTFSISAHPQSPSVVPNIGGGDVLPPVVDISPGTESLGGSQTLSVTIDWCDNVSLSGPTRTIYFNGVQVTSNFSYVTSTKSGCGGHATSTGNVTLISGSNSLSASIHDNAFNIGSNSVTYTYVPTSYGVTVTPDDQPVTADAQRSNSFTFRVTNTGNVSEQLNLAATCTATATACPASMSPITLANGAFQDVVVAYQAGTGGDTGTVLLRATYNGNGTITDVGSIRVTSQWKSYLAVDGSVNTFQQSNQQTSLCASSCFAASYAQSTIPYQSFSAPRNVSVVYNSDHVAVRPFVYEDVWIESGGYTVQQYWLEATINGTAVTFLNGETRLHFKADSSNPGRVLRLAGQFDGSGYATGLYNLAIIVTAQYSDHTQTFVDSLYAPRLLIDNERKSSTARGWTLAGLQHLYPQSDGSALITDGDGSALYFRCWPSASPCGGNYLAPQREYSSLTQSGSGANLVFTRAFPDSTKVMFNNLGQMASVSDRFGNTTAYSYDATGRLATIADPYRLSRTTGRHSVITLFYDTYGLTKITEPSSSSGDSAGGRTTVFVVAADSTLTSVQDPDGKSTRFLYDAAGRLASVVNRRGDTTTFAYNGHSWKLDSLISPKVPIDAGNGTTTMQAPVVRYVPWQSVDVPTSTTSVTPFVPVLSSSVVARVTDPEQHATQFTVDLWGQPFVTTDPLGRITTITRTDGMTTVVYPSGAKDTTKYNAFGLVTYSAPAGQDPTTISYTSYALPHQITGARQPTQIFSYGARGRDSLATIGSLTMRYFTDALGRDTAIVDPAGHINKLHYETTFGNLDSTLALGTGVPVKYTKVRFDGFGRDSVRMSSGQPGDTATYDLVNRVVRVASSGRGVTFTSYDPLFPTVITDGNGQVYRDSTNALGWRIQSTDPTGAVTKYRYNIAGLLTSYTNRRQQIISQSYDALHRILARASGSTVSDSFAYTTSGSLTVGWNAVSRDSIFKDTLTGWTDSSVTRFATTQGSQRFLRYYRAGMLQQIDSLGLGGPSTIAFTGRRYFWNASSGMIDSVKVGNSRFKWHYNGEGLSDTVTYPSSARRSIAYSSVHQPISLNFSPTSLDSVLTRTYRYDSVGQILEEDHKGKNGANENLHVFSYDAVGQLVGAQSKALVGDTTCTNPQKVPKGDFGIDCSDTTFALANQVNGYQYDSVGNLRQDYDSTAHVATLGTYLTGDRESSWGGTSYAYDADGNRITKTSGSQSVSYHWTPDGLLDTVTVGTVKLAYAYNAFGQLVRRSRNGVAERYLLWGRNQLLAELDGTATHRVGEYAYAPGTDAPIELITGSGTGPIQQYVQDGGGNVIGLFGPTSAITERQTYSPWGSVEAGGFTTLADTNRLRWKGLVWEGDSTQLYYVRARWYDPASRRFMSEDPLGLSGGINPYVYGAQDPVGNRDPTGTYIDSGEPCQFDQSEGCDGGGDGSFWGHGGPGFDESYVCDVKAMGAQACLDQAAAFLSNGTLLGGGWNSTGDACNPDGNWMPGGFTPIFFGAATAWLPTCDIIHLSSLVGKYDCGKGVPGSCVHDMHIGRCEGVTYLAFLGLLVSGGTGGEGAAAGASLGRTVVGTALITGTASCLWEQSFDRRESGNSSAAVSP